MNGDCLLCLVKEPGIMNFQQLPQRQFSSKFHISVFFTIHSNYFILVLDRYVHSWFFAGDFHLISPLRIQYTPFLPYLQIKKTDFLKNFRFFLSSPEYSAEFIPNRTEKQKKAPK